MIRRRTYRNNVKTSQIARMHACIDATLPHECVCPLCGSRFPEGQGLAEDRPEWMSSWQPMVYCSEQCKVLRPQWRP